MKRCTTSYQDEINHLHTSRAKLQEQLQQMLSRKNELDSLRIMVQDLQRKTAAKPVTTQESELKSGISHAEISPPSMLVEQTQSVPKWYIKLRASTP